MGMGVSDSNMMRSLSVEMIPTYLAVTWSPVTMITLGQHSFIYRQHQGQIWLGRVNNANQSNKPQLVQGEVRFLVICCGVCRSLEETSLNQDEDPLRPELFDPSQQAFHKLL